jgi:hypothetical protein
MTSSFNAGCSATNLQITASSIMRALGDAIDTEHDRLAINDELLISETQISGRSSHCLTIYRADWVVSDFRFPPVSTGA